MPELATKSVVDFIYMNNPLAIIQMKWSTVTQTSYMRISPCHGGSAHLHITIIFYMDLDLILAIKELHRHDMLAAIFL